jgi:ferredoxin-NADP reductase
MSPRRNKARLVAARMLSPSVRSLQLELEGGPLAFRAGQWVDVHVVAPGGPDKRAYSIASAPGAPLLELAVTAVEGGVVSPVLHAVELGAQLEVDGPHGFFTRDEPELAQAPALFVATGTGLAPLRSMLAEALAGEHSPFTLLFGCRTEDDILWREELETWAARDARFRLEVTLSRPDAGWSGRRGYVQTHVQELARR